MSKRACTTSNNTSNKRSKIDLSYDEYQPSPFFEFLVNSLEVYIRWNTNQILHRLREEVDELQYVDDGEPWLVDELLQANRNIYNYVKKYDLHTMNNEMTRFQAMAKGAMTRNRVVPAMLSADPTDLRQAVQFCVNGYK
jgi:hypothetical protein